MLGLVKPLKLEGRTGKVNKESYFGKDSQDPTKSSQQPKTLQAELI